VYISSQVLKVDVVPVVVMFWTFTPSNVGVEVSEQYVASICMVNQFQGRFRYVLLKRRSKQTLYDAEIFMLCVANSTSITCGLNMCDVFATTFSLVQGTPYFCANNFLYHCRGSLPHYQDHRYCPSVCKDIKLYF
jgi:hypothetical protein